MVIPFSYWKASSTPFSNTKSFVTSSGQSTQGVTFPATVANFTAGTASTLSFWMNASAPDTSNYMVTKMNTSLLGWQFELDTSTTGYFAVFHNSSSVLAMTFPFPSPILLNLWYHVVIAYDGTTSPGVSNFLIYMNGQLVTNTIAGTNTLGSNAFNSTVPLTLGNYGTLTHGYSHPIMFNNVATYNYKLSQSDVSAIYNYGSPPDLSKLSNYSNCTFWCWCGTGDSATASGGFIDHVAGNNGTGQNLTSANLVAVVPTSYPLAVSNVKLWLDASNTGTYSLSGSTITRWDNIAGSDYFTNAGSPSLSTTGGPNSTGAITFNATGYALRNTTAYLNGVTQTAYTVYVVFKTSSNLASTASCLLELLDTAATPNSFPIYSYGGTGYINLSTPTGGLYTGARASVGFGSASTWYLAAVTYNGSGTSQWYQNGSSTTTTTTSNVSHASATYTYIGNDHGDSVNVANEIAEIVVQGSQATAGELTAMSNYFSTKYGL